MGHELAAGRDFEGFGFEVAGAVAGSDLNLDGFVAGGGDADFEVDAVSGGDFGVEGFEGEGFGIGGGEGDGVDVGFGVGVGVEGFDSGGLGEGRSGQEEEKEEGESGPSVEHGGPRGRGNRWVVGRDVRVGAGDGGEGSGGGGIAQGEVVGGEGRGRDAETPALRSEARGGGRGSGGDWVVGGLG